MLIQAEVLQQQAEALPLRQAIIEAAKPLRAVTTIEVRHREVHSHRQAVAEAAAAQIFQAEAAAEEAAAAEVQVFRAEAVAAEVHAAAEVVAVEEDNYKIFN